MIPDEKSRQREHSKGGRAAEFPATSFLFLVEQCFSQFQNVTERRSSENGIGFNLSTSDLDPAEGGSTMNALTAALKEELNVEMISIGGLQIPESVVVSWGIMAFLVIGSILLTRNLRVDHITKRQAILETVVTFINDFFVGLLGEKGKRYVPYLISVALYIACSNLIGVFGIKPPTKDLNVTAALALMSICLIEYAGIHARGGVGFLKSLTAPTAIMTPMNILEIAIRPTSLCMRLFGNVLGAFVIMELIKQVVPVFVPAVFSLYFDLFDGLIQTYVFVFLTSLFMKENIGDEE